jgi:transglutaminase-like putative cysteine protease
MHKDFLLSTEFIDSDPQEVQEFTLEAVTGAQTQRGKAVRLYYAVRDGIYYDPYHIEPTRHGFKASTILRSKATGIAWPRPSCWPPRCAPRVSPADFTLRMSAII